MDLDKEKNSDDEHKGYYLNAVYMGYNPKTNQYEKFPTIKEYDDFIDELLD